MAKAKFVPNLAGYRAVLNSAGVQGEVASRADAIAAAAEAATDARYGGRKGEGGAAHYGTGEWRTKSGGTGRYVRTESFLARLDCAYHKTLTKAFIDNR